MRNPKDYIQYSCILFNKKITCNLRPEQSHFFYAHVFNFLFFIAATSR